MANPSIKVSIPAGAAVSDYESNGSSVWKLTVPKGGVRSVVIEGLGKATQIELLSNNPTVVQNDKIVAVKNGVKWIVSFPGGVEAVTLINIGYSIPGETPVAASAGPLILQIVVGPAASGAASFFVLPAEGQLDTTSCWAASFAWVTRVLPEVTTQSQLNIINASSGQTSASGLLSLNGFMTMPIGSARTERKRIPAADLPNYLKPDWFPLLIGFQSPGGFGHVNVIFEYDAASSMVRAMEPWFPDPSGNPAYDYSVVQGQPLYTSKADGSAFKFTGQLVKRNISYYSALGGEYVVGRIQRQTP